jgi:hypothetical protein
MEAWFIGREESRNNDLVLIEPERESSALLDSNGGFCPSGNNEHSLEGHNMELTELAREPRIQRIITHPEDDNTVWQEDLERFLSGDTTLTRHSVGESAITAVQRLMIFLGYSTSSSGAFAIDGDFGRGTNRGVAQFQLEHELTQEITRNILCYPCQWNTARRLITAIPEAMLKESTLKKMASVALERCDTGQIMTGDFDSAIFHLNALHKRQFLSCRAILERYGDTAHAVSQKLAEESNSSVRPEWILSIIKQESAGVIRPRFEQHYLSRLNRAYPEKDLEELRMRSMSLGLGQIMGQNYKAVGAANATELFMAPVVGQVAFVARFLGPRKDVVSKADPTDRDFRKVARFYNGPKYEAHHYHEGIARWFREFRALL